MSTKLIGPFRSMCGTCGRTNDGPTINEALLGIEHDANCDYHHGMPFDVPTIDLGLIKENNPKYFHPFKG